MANKISALTAEQDEEIRERIKSAYERIIRSGCRESWHLWIREDGELEELRETGSLSGMPKPEDHESGKVFHLLSICECELPDTGDCNMDDEEEKEAFYEDFMMDFEFVRLDDFMDEVYENAEAGDRKLNEGTVVIYDIEEVKENQQGSVIERTHSYTADYHQAVGAIERAEYEDEYSHAIRAFRFPEGYTASDDHRRIFDSEGNEVKNPENDCIEHDAWTVSFSQNRLYGKTDNHLISEEREYDRKQPNKSRILDKLSSWR